MRVFEENNIATNYHCEELLDMLYNIILQEGSLCPEFYTKKYVQIWEEICYNESKKTLQQKG